MSPLRIRKPHPDCGGMRMRPQRWWRTFAQVSLIPRAEGAAASGLARVLEGFGAFAEAHEHWVDRPLQRDVALADRRLQLIVAAHGAQRVELVVEVKDERRRGSPASQARQFG